MFLIGILAYKTGTVPSLSSCDRKKSFISTGMIKAKGQLSTRMTVLPFNRADTTLSGLSAGNYTAYQLVEGIVNTQATAVATASAKTVANIKAIREAAEKATIGVLGHLKTLTENWYLAPIPTKADLSADTTLASAKANAISLIKSEMAAKQIALSTELQNTISAIKTTKKPDINNTFKGNISLYIAKEKVITVKTINKNENIL